MKRTLRILVIDEYPMTIVGYKTIFKKMQSDFKIDVTGVHTIEELISTMRNIRFDYFDLVFLDLSLPSYINQTYIDGEDLGMLIRDQFPNAKIVIQTKTNSKQRLAKCFKTIQPEGLLIKSEIDEQVLTNLVNDLTSRGVFYSNIASSLIQPICSDKQQVDLQGRNVLENLEKVKKLKTFPLLWQQ